MPIRVITSDVGGVLCHFEGDEDVRLCGQVVDLVGPDLVHDLGDAGPVHEVAIVERDLGVPLAIGVCAEVADPAVVDVGTQAQGAVDLDSRCGEKREHKKIVSNTQ